MDPVGVEANYTMRKPFLGQQTCFGSVGLQWQDEVGCMH